MCASNVFPSVEQQAHKPANTWLDSTKAPKYVLTKSLKPIFRKSLMTYLQEKIYMTNSL